MKREIAEEYFKQGYNCAQSVVLAFKDEIGADAENVIKMISSFGGGMGRLREVCGAVSGMFFVLGCKYGYNDPKDVKAKADLYKMVQELAGRFKQINGSYVCKELLGVSGKESPNPAQRDKAYYVKRPCVQLVGDAAMILEEYLTEIKVVRGV